MAEAVKDTWPKCVHLLCSWHLFKNFHEHIYPLISRDKSDWYKVTNMSWKICKKSDAISKDSFDDEWDEMVMEIRKREQYQTKNKTEVSAYKL